MFPDARNAKKKPHGKKRKKSLPTESSKRRKLNDGSHVKVKPKHCTLQKIISSLIGARGVDILLQFLIEAVLISVTGGIIGVIMGVASSYAVKMIAGWPIFIQPYTVFLAFIVCTVTGVFFGWYPARKASALDPRSVAFRQRTASSSAENGSSRGWTSAGAMGCTLAPSSLGEASGRAHS